MKCFYGYLLLSSATALAILFFILDIVLKFNKKKLFIFDNTTHKNQIWNVLLFLKTLINQHTEKP